MVEAVVQPVGLKKQALGRPPCSIHKNKLPGRTGLYLSAFFSAGFFSSLRSSLLGLHFSQDLPSLWAETQHLCLHSLFSAAACSQQVSFFWGFSAARAAPTNSETAHPTTANEITSFIVFKVTAANLAYGACRHGLRLTHSFRRIDTTLDSGEKSQIQLAGPFGDG